MIRFSQVVKIYGEKAVLDNVSFEIEKGEFVSLLVLMVC